MHFLIGIRVLRHVRRKSASALLQCRKYAISLFGRWISMSEYSIPKWLRYSPCREVSGWAREVDVRARNKCRTTYMYIHYCLSLPALTYTYRLYLPLSTTLTGTIVGPLQRAPHRPSLIPLRKVFLPLCLLSVHSLYFTLRHLNRGEREREIKEQDKARQREKRTKERVMKEGRQRERVTVLLRANYAPPSINIKLHWVRDPRFIDCLV